MPLDGGVGTPKFSTRSFQSWTCRPSFVQIAYLGRPLPMGLCVLLWLQSPFRSRSSESFANTGESSERMLPAACREAHDD